MPETEACRDTSFPVSSVYKKSGILCVKDTAPIAYGTGILCVWSAIWLFNAIACCLGTYRQQQPPSLSVFVAAGATPKAP